MWLHSFIIGGTQTVKFNGKHSASIALITCVPQISVSGTILYAADIICMASTSTTMLNDMQLYIYCKPADAAVIVCLINCIDAIN